MAKKLAVLLVFMAVVSGCSSASNAPFHIYNSPLLNAQNHPSQRKSREFDPLDGMGDHPKVERVYAVNGGTDPQSQAQPLQPQNDTKKKLPSLSSTASTAVGGTAAEALVESSAIVSGYTPASAAEYAWQVYDVNGLKFAVAAKSSIPKLYKECKSQGKINHDAKPMIGDLVFFHNVADANKDGRNNDWYTHVAIVESVASDGTVVATGYAGGNVVDVSLNLGKPDATSAGQGEINSRLRDSKASDAPFTQYFASQLFAGYCSVLGNKSQFIAIDNWSPGAKVKR